jgi:hypothetical protein
MMIVPAGPISITSLAARNLFGINLTSADIIILY